ISADQRETVSSYVPDGAPVAIRGSAPDGAGYWFPPTVLCPVGRDDRAAREEIFGPVAAVIPFADEAEAVEIANDTIYGLSGSIWTRDGAKALRVARAIETGVLSINSNTSVRVTTPFGGFKQSGVGRELGPPVLDTSAEAWQRVQDANLKSVFLCCKHGIPHLLERGGGSVINTASFVAVMGAATSQSSYTASKGGVLALSRELGVQFARRGVRV